MTSSDSSSSSGGSSSLFVRGVSNSQLGKRGRGQESDETVKPKVNEMKYAASNVKADLEKGGIDFDSINKTKPFLDIPMSKVRRLNSSDVSKSPFLTSIDKTFRHEYNRCDVLNDLFLTTRATYIKNGSGAIGSDWDRSSSCSYSSDSENSTDYQSVVILPRLEDALKLNRDVSKSAEMISSKSPLMRPISMREALGPSLQARVVTLSFAPFMIIYVNSAFRRLTGLAPTDVLGRPFHEVIDEKCKASVSKASTLAQVHLMLAGVMGKGKDSNKKCRMRVSLVRPDSQESNVAIDAVSVTYVSIGLEPIDNPPKRNNMFGDAAISMGGTCVMG